jgi:hypothetical protein
MLTPWGLALLLLILSGSMLAMNRARRQNPERGSPRSP